MCLSMANTGGRAVRPIPAPALLWYTAVIELAMGSLMLMSSELFEADVYSFINRQLALVSALFLVGGRSSLLVLSGFWPKRLFAVVPFLVIAPPAVLALNFLLAGVASGVIVYSSLALALVVC